MSASHVTDNIPAYALGILEETERAEISLHLESCPACREELRSYTAVVEQLPMAAPQRIPPKRLRATILQAAAAQAEAPPHQRPGLLAWFARPLNPLVGLVGLVLIVLLAGFNIYQWQQAHQTAGNSRFSDFSLVAMTSPDANNKIATGILVINQRGNVGNAGGQWINQTRSIPTIPDMADQRWNPHQRRCIFSVWQRIRLFIHPFSRAFGQLYIFRRDDRTQGRQPRADRR